jgi:hypothetical protein
MKLSDAIAKGAKQVKPIPYSIVEVEDRKLCGCALGMALVGAVGNREARKLFREVISSKENIDFQPIYEEVRKHFPALGENDLELDILNQFDHNPTLETVNRIVKDLQEKGL